MNQEGIELAENTEEQKRRAAATAYQHAADEQEALMFWQMLGIIPTTERATCSRCNSPLEATSDRLWRERRGNVCSACYRRDLKDRKAVDA